MVTAPLTIAADAVVYVKVSLLLLVPAVTEVGVTLIVPVPSAVTVIDGDEARAVSVPPATDFCRVDHVCEPGVVGAVAPEPPPVLSPYVIVIVPLSASVTPETVTTWPETETVPVLAVV
jgi:hypothetical protein